MSGRLDSPPRGEHETAPLSGFERGGTRDAGWGEAAHDVVVFPAHDAELHEANPIRPRSNVVDLDRIGAVPDPEVGVDHDLTHQSDRDMNSAAYSASIL